jgi:hypothetical protein
VSRAREVKISPPSALFQRKRGDDRAWNKICILIGGPEDQKEGLHGKNCDSESWARVYELGHFDIATRAL